MLWAEIRSGSKHGQTGGNLCEFQIGLSTASLGLCSSKAWEIIPAVHPLVEIPSQPTTTPAVVCAVDHQAAPSGLGQGVLWSLDVGSGVGQVSVVGPAVLWLSAMREASWHDPASNREASLKSEDEVRHFAQGGEKTCKCTWSQGMGRASPLSW